MSVELTFALPRHRQAVGEARRLVTGMLSDLGAPRAQIDEIALALSEACTNAVEHSDGHGPFTLRVECDAGSVRLSVVSSGSFTPSQAALDMPGAAALRGRGVPLMRTLMDHFDIVANGASTTVSMCKNLRFTPVPMLLV